jgi:hypothetical protein
MYEYVAPFVIIALWWYDPTLLLKIQRYVKRTTTNLALSAVDFYVDLKEQKNEMVKDGYHINFVFLDFIEEFKIRRIDVTSLFRAEVLKGTFQNQGLSLLDFVELCRKPNNNLYYNDGKCRLEIDYTFDFKRYRVWYETDDNPTIVFPIYKESELRKRMFLPSVLSAILTNDPESESGIDVTREINEAAGPLGNFYDDKEGHRVKKANVLPDRGDDLFLCLIAHNGQSYTFGKDDIYLSLSVTTAEEEGQ